MAHAVPDGYTVEDLDWLRDELGVAHLELDSWGSLIVSPASDRHEDAVAILLDQVVSQLMLPGCVRVNSLAWKVPNGSGYVNVPDIAVMAPGWRRVGVSDVEPPPLLVVEVASPSTRSVDRGRKLGDYRLGGVGSYLLVDLPRRPTRRSVDVVDPSFELHDFAVDQISTALGRIELSVGVMHLALDLTESAAPGS